MSEQISQAGRALQAGVDEALREPANQPARRSTASDDEIMRILRELATKVNALEQRPVKVPVSAITSVRLQLAESDLMAGVLDSPRASLAGLLVGVAAVSEYLQPGVLGEFLPLLSDQSSTSTISMAVAALTLIFGRYGANRAKPADGSITPAEK
jgi:hypothetical protein